MKQFTPEEMRAALAQSVAHARKFRNFTADEGRAMVAKKHLGEALAKLRPVRWPDADPMPVRDAAFVLGVTPKSVYAAIQTGRLRATAERLVARAALASYLRRLVREAEAQGLPIPPEASAFLAQAGIAHKG